jgi:hypothetical protein
VKPDIDALIEGGKAVINTVTEIMRSEAQELKKAAGNSTPASAPAGGGAEPTPPGSAPAPQAAAAATPTELLAKITATRKILRDFNANMDTIKKNLNSYAKVLDWDQVLQLVEKVDDEAASSETSIDRVRDRLAKLDNDIDEATKKGDTGKIITLKGQRTRLEGNLQTLQNKTAQDVTGPQLQQVSANGKELVGRFKLLTSEGDKFVKELGEMTKAMDDDAGKMKSELIEFWKQFASNPMMSKQKIDQLERYFEGNFTMERVGELKAYNAPNDFAVPDIKSKLTPDQQERYGWIESGLLNEPCPSLKARNGGGGSRRRSSN